MVGVVVMPVVIAVKEEMPVMAVMAVMLVMLVMPVIVVMIEENDYDKIKVNTARDIKILLFGTPLSGKTPPRLL